MEHSRLFVDSTGVEWEVYDETRWSIAWALDWEYPPQPDNPGLLFDSSVGRRRIFPCPANWQSLSDAELEELLAHARSLT
ncbi:MAG: hypothetical protein JWL61_2272 [Gemmatimonadetes bacterium]|jgi:hypothetical protein|nr:hypothetical protein [Gemmatimonadota bacterium]